MKQLLVLCLLFAGCQCPNRNAFVVNKYESHNGNFCNYYLSRECYLFEDRLQVVDSCGKFQVGDTLMLNQR